MFIRCQKKAIWPKVCRFRVLRCKKCTMKNNIEHRELHSFLIQLSTFRFGERPLDDFNPKDGFLKEVIETSRNASHK